MGKRHNRKKQANKLKKDRIEGIELWRQNVFNTIEDLKNRDSVNPFMFFDDEMSKVKL